MGVPKSIRAIGRKVEGAIAKEIHRANAPTETAMLREACQKLAASGLIKDCSPALRDWFGRDRADHRRATEGPHNIFTNG